MLFSVAFRCPSDHDQKLTISHSTLTVIWQSMAVVRMMLIAISDICRTADQQSAEAGQASSQTLMTAHTYAGVIKLQLFLWVVVNVSSFGCLLLELQQLLQSLLQVRIGSDLMIQRKSEYL